ncbi:hypothetical protein E2C01_095102 [Portunus trituberculatus]|uniref:Uncharacterized protein n=1 Tax=Portunus trituberculatus TaxID=210409 RepID=A0A5B7K4W5_PORTR|nr:hypothetical protein [Portunus trituberculatus]
MKATPHGHLDYITGVQYGSSPSPSISPSVSTSTTIQVNPKIVTVRNPVPGPARPPGNLAATHAPNTDLSRTSFPAPQHIPHYRRRV